MEATASLDKLRALLPPGIDPENHPTLLYVAANLAVGGVENLNGDALTIEDTLRTYRGFEWQLVDVEHERSTIVGFIVKAGLSELGTDRLITEDEARAAGNPVNIAVVLALWKVADSDLCHFIEGMDAPGSPDRGKLSLSFEVGFDDYDVVVMPNGATNLSLATQIVTPDSPDFSRFDKLLRVNGGKGAFGKDAHVARILMGNIVPLGAGIVTVPAAAVKGLTTITSNPHVEDTSVGVNETEAGMYKYSSTQVTFASEDAEMILAFARSIPDDHIYTDEKDPTLGREREPHVTIAYGLTTADPAAVQACLANVGPIHMTLGEVAAFSSDDRDYDVLHVAVHSDDLHRLNSLIKTVTEVKSSYPTYSPHCTVAYVKKGMARGYVGDTRFKGRGLTVPSVSFSPHTGDRIEIPLKMVDGAETVTQTPSGAPHTDQFGQVKPAPAQTEDDGVYLSTDPMATVSRQIKLSQGWQERLAALQAAAGKEGTAPLPNGVNLTLSDGRTLSNVKVFDGSTLELDKELSMSGVVITDMTPGARPQADDQANEDPSKAVVYPTKSPEQQARDAQIEAERVAGQNAAYTDAKVAKADPADGDGPDLALSDDEGYAMSEDEVKAAADKAKKPYGDVQYADPGYQKDGKKRYPIDTPAHIRAAWSYINKPKNCSEYSSSQCASIKSKIVSAWKKHIDPKGSPSANASVETALAQINAIFSLSSASLVRFASSLLDTTANASTTSVSPSNLPTHPMNLSELKQSLASVKTVEDLPTVVANVASFADAIAAASEKMVAERTAAQDATKAAQASLDEIKTQMAALKLTNDQMVASQQAAAAQAAFNDNMTAVEATFDLDTEVRAEIVDEVKACATPEAFAKWLTSAKKKMKGFIKKKADPKDDPKDDDSDDDDAKAAKAAKAALASAAANPTDAAHRHDFAATASLNDAMQTTFANNITIGGVKVSELRKAKK